MFVDIDICSASDCLDCNRQLEKPCQVHNTEYSYIEDTPLLSRARASLPHCFYLRETEAAVYKSLGKHDLATRNNQSQQCQLIVIIR